MAAIALYASQINRMPGMILEVKQTVTDYKSELEKLKNKTLAVNKSICNLESVLSAIQASTLVQEQKSGFLDGLREHTEEFTAEAVRIDAAAAERIRDRTDEFYQKYNYLKPDCRKDFYELAKEWFDGAGEWCREHWKAVTTALIVIAAVALMCTGIGGILGAVALGALLGAGIGGLTGGILSAAMGGSFWEGVENGAFAGAVSGMIAGGMGYAMTGGAALSLGQSMAVGAVSGSGCSLITDLGGMVIGGERLSVGQVLLNLTVSGGMGAAFAGIGYGLSKAFTALKVKIWGGKGGLEPGTLSNVDARKWYLEQEAKIPDLINDGLPLEQQARQAFDLRNQYRMQARELMSDRQLEESLYATDPNLTWEQIIQKQIDKGLSGDDIYQAIIESSQRSRTSVNQLLGLD